MSTSVLWLATIAALGIVVVRRRSLAIGLIAAQSLLLGAQAISDAAGQSTGLLVAGVVLIVKAVALPALLALVVIRTREPGRIASERHPLLRLSLALAIALTAAVLVPRFGPMHREEERATLGLVALGIAIAIVRRPAIFQALGFLAAENGLYAAALLAPKGLPVFVDLGLVFDLVIVIFAAGAFSARIHAELGTGDTSQLGDLHD